MQKDHFPYPFFLVILCRAGTRAKEESASREREYSCSRLFLAYRAQKK